MVVIGPSETGKSTVIKLGLSIVGMDESSLYVSGSTSFFLERSSMSTLHFGIDDPPEPNYKSTLKPADVIVSIYNGAKTANMKRNITPLSSDLVAAASMQSFS